jgi:hypothetical protein
MKRHTNINSTPFTQLPHKFSYLVAILGHNHFESPKTSQYFTLNNINFFRMFFFVFFLYLYIFMSLLEKYTGLFTVKFQQKFNFMQHKIQFKTAPRFNFL